MKDVGVCVHKLAPSNDLHLVGETAYIVNVTAYVEEFKPSSIKP